jgi:hypothetical protein
VKAPGHSANKLHCVLHNLLQLTLELFKPVGLAPVNCHGVEQCWRDITCMGSRRTMHAGKVRLQPEGQGPRGAAAGCAAADVSRQHSRIHRQEDGAAAWRCALPCSNCSAAPSQRILVWKQWESAGRGHVLICRVLSMVKDGEDKGLQVLHHHEA